MRRVVLALSCVLLVAASAPARAQRGDAALAAAREIARRVRRFPSFRARVAHGVWEEHPERVWSIRDTASCHEALRAASVPFEPIRTRRTPIPAPVRVSGPIAGVSFRKQREGAPLIVACELATRLPTVAAVLARHGVHEVRVLSAWRTEPETSFHTMGLALDLHTFVRARDELVVERDADFARAAPTCAVEPPRAERAAALHAIACDLARSGVLSTVITPAYSEGHRDHLHVDARPDDPRSFVR